MANGDAESHRSADTSNNNCTLQALTCPRNWHRPRQEWPTKMLGDTAVQAPAATTAHCKHQMPEARHGPKHKWPVKMLGDSAVQTPAVTTAHCKHNMPEKLAQTKARMANEDAKSHCSTDNSSHNCTLQASSARDQA